MNRRRPTLDAQHEDDPIGFYAGVLYGVLIEALAVAAALLIGYALGWIPLAG